MRQAQVFIPAKDRPSLSQPFPWSSPTRVPWCSKRNILKVNYQENLGHKRVWPRAMKRKNRHDFVTRALAREPWCSLAVLELCISNRALLNREDGGCCCTTEKWAFPEPWFILQRSSITLDRNWKNGVLVMSLPSKIWVVVYIHVFPFLWVLIISIRTWAEENLKFQVWEQAHTLLLQSSSSSLMRLLLKDKVKSWGGFLVLCDCPALSIEPLSLQTILLGLTIEIPSSKQRRHCFSQLPLLPSHQSDLGIQMSCGLWLWL